MDYPKEWDELPKRERKKKIRELKRRAEKKKETSKKIRNAFVVIVLVVIVVVGYRFLTKRSPEEIAFEQEVNEVSLEGIVEEFSIEGRSHVAPVTKVDYKTNPPSSGNHYDTPADWGIYEKELDDEAVVHSLEHGGIWISYKRSLQEQGSYKDISEETIQELKQIGKENPGSVIVSPRPQNSNKIAVVSWGRMMKLESVDKALIQKYIETYKNQSPEKLAR